MSTGKWLLYGLLENRDDDHDLRFITVTDDPMTVAAEHPEYEACMAFPADSRRQIDRGTKVVRGAAAVAMLGMGLATQWAPEHCPATQPEETR